MHVVKFNIYYFSADFCRSTSGTEMAGSIETEN